MKLFVLLASTCALVIQVSGDPDSSTGDCESVAKAVQPILEPALKCVDDNLNTTIVTGLPSCYGVSSFEEVLKKGCESGLNDEQAQCVATLTAPLKNATPQVLMQIKEKCLADVFSK